MVKNDTQIRRDNIAVGGQIRNSSVNIKKGNEK
jgi:hypothetical protein